MARRAGARTGPAGPGRPQGEGPKGVQETAPCPRCGASVPVAGERGACPSCGLAVRFEDAPERPCARCGAPVAFLPGKEAVRCAACGAWHAADPARGVVGRATCVRCRRRIEVPLEAREAGCPHCGTRLLLGDSLATDRL